MREMLAAALVVHMIVAFWFPQFFGNTSHRIFNDWKIGWEQVK